MPSTEGIGLAFQAGALAPRFPVGTGPRFPVGTGPRFQVEWGRRFQVALTLGGPKVQRCHFEMERRCLGDRPMFEFAKAAVAWTQQLTLFA